MNQRERLYASLRGESVDRPPVSFYEIDGFQQDADNADPFNNYNGTTWRPLLELARDCSDSIVSMGANCQLTDENPMAERMSESTWTDENGSLITHCSIRADNRTLTATNRRDPAINTVWQTEHLLKDEEDLAAWLTLPEGEPVYTIDTSSILEMEQRIGDAGIIMLNAPDPVCIVAPLFDMGTWTVMAMTEPDLIQQALERTHRHIMGWVEMVARELPGRLWRIVGPEYASEPYMPPHLFNAYVTPYLTDIVQAIQQHGGFARVHSHGRLKNILDHIAATGCVGLDPIEPPHQGDVELAYVREKYGAQMTLFGNIEITDIENMPTREFEKKIATALREGPGKRGFVLMPSACPYGREITPLCLRNYERMIEMAQEGM